MAEGKGRKYGSGEDVGSGHRLRSSNSIATAESPRAISPPAEQEVTLRPVDGDEESVDDRGAV